MNNVAVFCSPTFPYTSRCVQLWIDVFPVAFPYLQTSLQYSFVHEMASVSALLLDLLYCFLLRQTQDVSLSYLWPILLAGGLIEQPCKILCARPHRGIYIHSFIRAILLLSIKPGCQKKSTIMLLIPLHSARTNCLGHDSPIDPLWQRGMATTTTHVWTVLLWDEFTRLIKII